MTGLSKITDKIIAEAHSDAEKILAEADLECRRIAAEWRAKAAQIKKASDEAAEKEAASIVSRAKSSAAMEERAAALEAQSALIDRVFESAKKEILYLPDDKYLDFLTSMLAKVLLDLIEDERVSLEVYGEDEDMNKAEFYEVMLCERDLSRYGDKLIESLRRRFVGKEGAELLPKVKLSKKPVKIDGGLILRRGDIEVNSSLSMIFDLCRPEMEVQVSRILFEGDNKQ